MPQDFGNALRTMRDDAGLSLSALAAHANVSKPHLGHLETGQRQPTTDVAAAIDRALHAGGVLTELAALQRGEGDPMRRRTLLATLGAAAGIGVTSGPHTLADLIRHGLHDDAGTDEDWDAVVDDCGRRLVTHPTAAFGAALLTNLAVLRQLLAEKPTTSLLRAAADLGQMYGLWLGNQNQLGGANHWYRSAAALADRSGDVDTRAYVRGRAASRGIYEDWTVARTVTVVDETLALTTRPTLGALEAQAALVGVHALTRDVRQGRAAVHAMTDVADRLDGQQLRSIIGPVERTVFLRAFFECRAGSLDDAEQACDAAERILVGLPTWLAETRVYRARAMVAAGDVAAGLEYALRTVRQQSHGVRVIGVAVRDVCCAAPAGWRGDDLTTLWRYADPNPGPWETLR